MFVEHDGKAVEISDREGQRWVEFWDASDDEDAAPVKDRFFPTARHAVDAATYRLFQWGNRRTILSSWRAVGSQVPQNRSSIKTRPAFSRPAGAKDREAVTSAPRSP